MFLAWFLSPIGRMVGIGVAGALVGAYLAYAATSFIMHEKIVSIQGQLDTCKMQRETDRANANAKALTEYQRGTEAARDANTATSAAAAQRLAQTASLMEKLRHVPKTQACPASPAIRAYLDSLRH